MKSINNTAALQAKIEIENHYYRDGFYESYSDLENGAKSFFEDVTSDYENKEAYYNSFGGVHIRRVKSESYFNEETNLVETVEFYEGYIDSGVSADSYFYGFIITE